MKSIVPSPYNAGARQHDRKAFTLIEMTVVITIIALLAGVVLRTIALVSRQGDRARTMARIQRVSNAVEGFYAEYGQYPPVPLYPSGAFLASSDRYYCRYCGHDHGSTNPGSNQCRRPGCRENSYTTDFQPFGYEFPYRDESEYYYSPQLARALGQSPAAGQEAWQDRIAFTFGLMSFLVERNPDYIIDLGLDEVFGNAHWNAFNTSRALSARDAAALQKWQPQLEGILTGRGNIRRAPRPGVHNRELLGTREYRNAYQTVVDAWYGELYYKSAPPFQTYRIWAVEPGSGRILENARWDD